MTDNTTAPAEVFKPAQSRKAGRFGFGWDTLIGRLGLLIGGLLFFLALTLTLWLQYQVNFFFERGASQVPMLRLPLIIDSIESAGEKSPEEIVAGLSHPRNIYRVQDAPAGDPNDTSFRNGRALGVLERMDLEGLEAYQAVRRNVMASERWFTSNIPSGKEMSNNDIADLTLPEVTPGYAFPVVRPETDGLKQREVRLIVHSVKLAELDGKWLNIYARVITPDLFPALASFLIVFAVMLFGIALAAYLATRLMRPFRAMAEAAERFGRGESIDAVQASGPADMRSIVSTFNDMSLKLEQARRGQRNLIFSLGHDVKGPAISAIEIAKSLPDSEQKRQLDRQLENIVSMVASITSIATQSQKPSHFVKADLGSLIETMVDDYANTGKDVTFTEKTEATVRCRPSDLERVLQNLIDNALRYAGSANVIFDRVSEKNVEIRVEDQGPGIPEDMLSSVKEPFRRGTEQYDGSGLGLAIADTILTEIGGRLILENRAKGGLRARVRLRV